jgi:hypothetical protein
MNDVLQFRPSKFKEVLRNIRGKYRLYDEIAECDCEGISNLCRRIENIPDDKLHYFVMMFKTGDIELAMLSLKAGISQTLERKLCKIITERFNKRFFILGWHILQYRYNSNNFIDLMKQLCGKMRDKHAKEYGNLLLSRLDLREKLPAQAVGILKNEGQNIKEFIKKYEVNLKSPFAMNTCRLFFTGCDKEGFLRNKDIFFYIFDNTDLQGRTAMISNYLDLFNIAGCIDDINERILLDYGSPSHKQKNEFFKLLGERLALKFEKWLFLKKAREYFKDNEKKYNFWEIYCENFKNVWVDADAYILFIDMGEIVAVDIDSSSSESYVFTRNIFDMEYSAFISNNEKGKDSWKYSAANAVNARNYIIDGINSEVFKICYEGAALLFARDLLSKLKMAFSTESHSR